MTQTHTPAPWATDEYGNEITAGNVLVGRVHSTFSASAAERKKFKTIGLEDAEVLKANGRLMAASPDLLEALELALQAHDDDKSWEDLAIAAINKARGQV